MVSEMCRQEGVFVKNPVPWIPLKGIQSETGMTKPQKRCFGILDKVFPMGNEGLREIVHTCFDCPDKQACLKEALNTEQGLRFRSEVMDRSPSSGLAGRFKRWSEKKDLDRRLKRKKGKKK